MPETASVAVSIGEPVNNVGSSSATGGGDERGWSGDRFGGGDLVLASGAAVESHGTEGNSLSEGREKNGGKLLGVKAGVLGEGDGVQLLLTVESPAELGRCLGKGLSGGGIAAAGGVELDGESSSSRSLDAQRNTSVALGLSIVAAKLRVEVRAGVLGNDLDTVLGGLANSERGHGTIGRRSLGERVVEHEGEARLRCPVIDQGCSASSSGSNRSRESSAGGRDSGSSAGTDCRADSASGAGTASGTAAAKLDVAQLPSSGGGREPRPDKASDCIAVGTGELGKRDGDGLGLTCQTRE